MVMAEDAIFLALKNAASSVMTDLSPDLLTEQASLRELGANSVDRAEILMRVMEEQQLMVSMVRFASCQNLGDIAKVLREASLAG
jgi:polyketide biosynthesis acyl carrier protein